MWGVWVARQQGWRPVIWVTDDKDSVPNGSSGHEDTGDSGCVLISRVPGVSVECERKRGYRCVKKPQPVRFQLATGGSPYVRLTCKLHAWTDRFCWSTSVLVMFILYQSVCDRDCRAQ